MNLELKRLECGKVCTIGHLLVDGELECWTLEDVVRADGVKIPGETAIPPGTYEVDITYSPRFKVHLPLLIGVKGFVGIRIHPGNDSGDTEGCILVGRSRGPDRVNESRKAFDALFEKMKAARAKGQAITLTVR